MSKALWRRTVLALRAQTTWEESDVWAVERYIRSVERGRLARESRKGVLVTSGSQGQEVAHPSLKD